MRNFTVSMVVVLSLMLSACAGVGSPNQNAGHLFGGIIGGVAGANLGGGKGKIVGAVLGTLIGAGVGAEIGRKLDERDRIMMQKAQYTALETAPTGKAVQWSNPDTGVSGETKVMSTKVEKDNGGYERPCREYKTSVVIDGKFQEVYGRACREAGNKWVIAGA